MNNRTHCECHTIYPTHPSSLIRISHNYTPRDVLFHAHTPHTEWRVSTNNDTAAWDSPNCVRERALIASWPAGGAVSLWLGCRALLHQVAFAADDPQLVLVRRGQVHSTGWDSRTQVPWTRDVQVSVGMRPVFYAHTHTQLVSLAL